MKTHIIYAHPNVKSFNNAILKVVSNSLEANKVAYTISDLYATNFNPILKQADRNGQSKDLVAEHQKVTQADLIITIYPVWWTQMPAILKGYIERVFAYIFAHQSNKNETPTNLLDSKKAVIISTFGHPYAFYEKEGYLSAFEKTVDEGIFNYVGIEVIKHFHLGGIKIKTNEERIKDLAKIESLFNTLFINA